MTDQRSVNEVEEGDDYYHVQYQDPDNFDEIRTPDWAEKPANSVSEGSEVRTGDTEGDEDWEIQSVLVPVDNVANEDEARQTAEEIVDKIES